MGNIADKLQSILQAKEDIKNALQNKGVIISSSDPFRSYAGKISNISQFEQENAVRFFDYNGDVLYRYTFDEISALAELPTLPVHTGLICQGWNWTLEDVKQTVLEYGKCDVGAMYITDDGKTRLYISILTDGRMRVPLYFYQSVANGVTIDWGDGTVETVSTSGIINPIHNYEALGDYVITLDVAEGCTMQLGHGSENYNIIGYYSGNGSAYSAMLNGVEIGARVTDFKPYCFWQCVSMSFITIPNTINSISARVFGSCKSLKHLNIPNSVTKLYAYSIAYCSVLSNISLPNEITALESYTFNDSRMLESIIIPNVTSIPSYIFANCSSLCDVILGKNVTTIGEYAFDSTRSLTKINLHGTTTIGQYAFRYSQIREIVIPEGVTTIPAYAFQYAYSLVNVSLPSTLTTIGTYAFSGCRSLKEIYIPNSVISIGTYAFNECTSLVSATLPNGITNLPTYLFYNCTSLMNVNIPDTVTTIDNYAFRGTQIRNITIPNNIVSMGTGVFAACERLPKVTLPSMGSISAELFNACKGLGIVDLTNFGKIPGKGSNAFYNISSDCKILVPSHLYGEWSTNSSWSSEASKIVSGFTVSNITAYNMTANDVLFGNTLYTDGEFACHVYGLDYSGNAETKVYRMDTDSLHVGTNKTANTVSKEVTFEYMGDAFTTTVTQGPYVENAIICTYNVTSTTSNTMLLYSSFSNYSTYFSSMIIDGEEMPIATSYKFSTIGEHSVLFKIAEGVDITNLYRMFYTCSALKTVDLSELDMSLVTSTSTSAGTAYMFYNCSGLKSIVLPETVSYLGYYMFRGCTNVKRFIIKAKTAPTLYGNYTFGYSSDWLGYNYRTESNAFYIPHGATGYDTTTWTNYLFSTSYCGFKKSSPYIKQECTNLEITANDVKWKATTTLINWTATVNCLDVLTEETIELTFTGTEISEPFPQNMSETETAEREISFTYMGVTATTTITQGVYIYQDYNVDLNNQWRLSTSVTNPNPSLYEGVYESNSNYHVSNGIAKMYIDIVGYTEFKFYIRSNGESNYDYVRVGNLDQDPATSAYVTTKGKQNSGTAINNYTLVTFSNIDKGSHRIIIDYIKDSSSDSGTDRGYVIIPIGE